MVIEEQCFNSLALWRHCCCDRSIPILGVAIYSCIHLPANSHRTHRFLQAALFSSSHGLPVSSQLAFSFSKFASHFSFFRN